MILKDQPIRRKLMTVILLTSGAVLLLTCGAFFAYELLTLRQGLVQSLTTLAEITAENITSSLAFKNADDALGVLTHLTIEKNVLAAGLYDNEGKLFASYARKNEPTSAFPSTPEKEGHRFA